MLDATRNFAERQIFSVAFPLTQTDSIPALDAEAEAHRLGT